MKNKIYLLNYWWAANYGANLTAYALNHLIPSSILINNSDIKQKLCEALFSFHTQFANDYLKVSADNISNLMNGDNTFIVGSDQVFRPCLNKNISDSFYLDYASNNSKKIAFSASFGVDKEQFLIENSPNVIKKIKKSLQTFDLISVREKSGVEICKDVFDIDAELVIDPVFIVNKTKYLEMIEQVSTNKYSNKIVAHLVANADKKINQFGGEKVINLHNTNVSVEEWLSAIKDCKLLIADSYHAVCFAIIFNKPFITITKQVQGRTRFESICEMLRIENQCINSIEEIYEKDCIFKIDYECVNKRIEEERQRGLEFLKKALETPCGKQKEKEEVRTRYLEQKVCELEQQATLKYQIKQKLWYLWLIIWYKYLPKPVKFIINLFRRNNG